MTFNMFGVSVFGTISNNHNFAYLIFHAFCFYSVVFWWRLMEGVGVEVGSADYCYWMMRRKRVFFSSVVMFNEKA